MIVLSKWLNHLKPPRRGNSESTTTKIHRLPSTPHMSSLIAPGGSTELMSCADADTKVVPAPRILLFDPRYPWDIFAIATYNAFRIDRSSLLWPFLRKMAQLVT